MLFLIDIIIIISFGYPLKGYKDTKDRKDEQKAKFREFILQYHDLLKDISSDEVRVIYAGKLDDESIPHLSGSN